MAFFWLKRQGAVKKMAETIGNRQIGTVIAYIYNNTDQSFKLNICKKFD